MVGSTFVAENTRGLAIHDFENDSIQGKFPGGQGRFVQDEDEGQFDLEHPIFAYCHLEFVGDLVVIHDRCYTDQYAYQTKMLEYLKRVCGGKVGVWSEYFLDGEDAPDTAEKITAEYANWRQPGEEAE